MITGRLKYNETIQKYMLCAKDRTYVLEEGQRIDSYSINGWEHFAAHEDAHLALSTVFLPEKYREEKTKPIFKLCSVLLKCSQSELSFFLYRNGYLVIDSGHTLLCDLQMLTKRSYADYREKYGDTFTVLSGVSALEEAVSRIDFQNIRVLEAIAEYFELPFNTLLDVTDEDQVIRCSQYSTMSLDDKWYLEQRGLRYIDIREKIKEQLILSVRRLKSSSNGVQIQYLVSKVSQKEFWYISNHKDLVLENLMVTASFEETIKSDLNISIDDLNLSVRAYNCLKRANVNTIGALSAMTEDELKHVRNLGRTAANEVISLLLERGLFLRKEAASQKETIYDDEDTLFDISDIGFDP